LAVVGCIGGFSGCWRAYWRGQCLSAALQESAVLSLYRCRQLLAMNGGCGLHRRVQRLLAVVLGGSMFIGGLAGVGGIVIVSVSAVVGEVGGCGLHWRAQWLLAGVLAGSMFIGVIAGVGGIIIVSVSAVVGDPRRLWAALSGSAVVGGRIGGVNVYRQHCRSRRYYHCIGVGRCWRPSAVVGCIGGFSGCWRAYWRGQCLSAELQELAVLSLYRCRQLLAMNGGCGLHRRVQRLLAVILAGSLFIGGIAGVGGVIIVSVSAVVVDPRRLWAALAGSVAVGGRIGGVNVYRRHCMSRRYYHCLGVIFELFQFFN
jgi:hypothetical protein